MRCVVVVALLALASGLASAQITCTSIDTVNAQGTCGGVVYDLSQMVTAGGSHQFVAQAPDLYNYYFQMTSGGLPPSQTGCPFAAGIDYGNAVGQGSADGTTCYPCGLVGQQQWTLMPGNPQTLTVNFNGGQEGRTATLVVTCNANTRGTYTVRGETKPFSKIYELDMDSCAACANGCGGAPPSPSPGPSPPPPPGSDEPAPVGWILIGVFFGSLTIYFVGGMVFLKYSRQQSGRDIVPHVDFWTSLPGLVKDGVMFCVNKIRGREGSYSSL